MTMLCVPVQTEDQARLAFTQGADLVEWKIGPVKHLIDIHGTLCFIDTDISSPIEGSIASYHNYEETPQRLGSVTHYDAKNKAPSALL